MFFGLLPVIDDVPMFLGSLPGIDDVSMFLSSLPSIDGDKDVCVYSCVRSTRLVNVLVPRAAVLSTARRVVCQSRCA